MTVPVESLERACRTLIRDAEHFLDAAGLRMTSGTETEWYSVEPVKYTGAGPQVHYRNLTNFLERAGPCKFIAERVLPIDAEQFEGFSDAETIERIQDMLKMLENRVLRQVWINHRIHELCGQAKIGVHRLHAETGTSRPGELFRLQQFEVSTTPKTPGETAHDVDRCRELIRQANCEQGLGASFASYPTDAVLKQLSEPVDVSSPCGTHVHFGLRRHDGSSALVTSEGVSNALSRRIDRELYDLLAPGGRGSYLLNPAAEDYAQFAGFTNSPKRLVLPVCPPDSREARRALEERRPHSQAAFHDVSLLRPKGFDQQLPPDERHKELRLGGGATPGALLLGVPAFATALGVAREAGILNEAPLSWIGRSLRGHGKVDPIVAWPERLDARALDRLAAAAEKPHAYHAAEREQPVAVSVEEALERSRRQNLFERHAPEVAAAMPGPARRK